MLIQQALLVFVLGGIFGVLLCLWGYAKGSAAGYNRALAEEYQKLEDCEGEDDYPCDDCQYNTDLVEEDDEDESGRKSDKATTEE